MTHQDMSNGRMCSSIDGTFLYISCPRWPGVTPPTNTH